MSLQQWAITAGVKGAIRDAEKDGKVAELAATADKLVRAFCPDDPRGVKFMLVQNVIFPFVKLFLKDDPDGYAKAKAGL